MNFTKTGTLDGWSIGRKVVIPEIEKVKKNTFRGGAFLCIPNFDLPGYPFTTKHGEYRDVVCESALPHKKLLAPKDGGTWGKISTQTLWEEKEVHGLHQLEVRTRIEILSIEAALRPGFHPYFKVHDSFTLNIGLLSIASKDIPIDKPLIITAHKNNLGTVVATLITGNTHINIASTVEGDVLESDGYFSFCIWSDDPKKYICVEPVYGQVYGLDNLPTPLIVKRGQDITLINKILVSIVQK